MLLAEAKQFIARLDPGSATALLGALLSAECTRLYVPAEALVISDAITEPDEGLDARVDGVPETAPTPPPPALPPGTVGLQLKTTRRKQPSALGLADELAKPGPRRVLEDGGHYVLVWTQDLNEPQRQGVMTALRTEAEKIVEDPSVRVWDATTLAQLLERFPSVAADIGLADFEAAISLPELLESSELRAGERPFISDPAREGHLARIRGRASTTSDPIVMGVVGDPGAGKTRLVAEALDTEELRQSVLYVNGTDGLERLLTRLIRNSFSRGILFVDEVDDHDVGRARDRIGGLNGRWRLVSVTSRGVRKWQPEGPRDLVLEPLSPEATKELVQQHAGLSPHQATMVAEVAAGFPELAFRLAEELREDPTLDLVTLSRLSQPQEILKRALDDNETRRHLGPLALFTAVGFEDDLRYQAEAVAAAFGLDLPSLEIFVERELGRFVSRAGRYRLVSPRLVAIWLATDLIETTPGFTDIVFALPEPLPNAFIEQLDFFGPDVPHLPAALRNVLEDGRFRSPTDFDDAAGRFLRASAAIIPAQVAESIQRLVSEATPAELSTLPRRDLVWALEVLLWWPETWQTALDSLYRLAQHESETWANNATGQFTQFFSIYLSGTTVAHSERFEWLLGRIEQAQDEDLSLLASAAAAGLKDHHTRSMTGFRGGGEPRDWQPETTQEYFDARASAWDAVLLIRDRANDAELRAACAKHLENAMRTMFRSAGGEHVRDTLKQRQWSVDERAVLAAGVRDVIRYEAEMPLEVRALAEAVHAHLMGAELEDRAEIIVRTSVWDLHSDRDTIHDTPPLLVELADEIASHEEGLALSLQVGRDLQDQATRFQLLRLVGTRIGPRELGEGALAAASPDWAALSAALSVTADEAGSTWIDGVIERVAHSWPEQLPGLLRYTALTPERLDFVLDQVEGGAPAAPLGELLYGARIEHVDPARAMRLIRVVANTGRLDQAAGMLDQWLERNNERPDDVRELAFDLALPSIQEGGGSMVDYHIERWLDAGVFEFPQVVALWEARMIHRSGLPDQLDNRLTESALGADAQEMTRRIIALIKRQAVGDMTFGLYASGELALLSRAARVLSPEETFEAVSALSDQELGWAMHHMFWGGNEPDALVRLVLTSDRLNEDLGGEASSCFFNSLGTVMGSMARAMEGELQRARSWEEHLRDTAAAEWARQLVAGYQRTVESERLREEERDMRFR